MPESTTKEQAIDELSDERVRATIDAFLDEIQPAADRWAVGTITYLTLANGGAAAAVLAFMGAQAVARSILIVVALFIFGGGLVIVGALWIWQGRRSAHSQRACFAQRATCGARICRARARHSNRPLRMRSCQHLGTSVHSSASCVSSAGWC